MIHWSANQGKEETELTSAAINFVKVNSDQVNTA